MTFGEVLGKSWEEYRANFKPILKAMLIFAGIATLILTLLNLYFIHSDQALLSYFMNSNSSNDAPLTANYLLSALGFPLIAALFMLFVQVGIISASLKKSEFSYSEIVEGSKSNFFRFLGFLIISTILLVLLYLLLIVPGIIFTFWWVFGAYIFLEKRDKGIMESLKESKRLVKGRWWTVVGYLILLGLIMMGISIVITILNFPIAIISMITVLSQGAGTTSFGLFAFSTIWYTIIRFIGNMIALPLGILFTKNLYFYFRDTR